MVDVEVDDGGPAGAPLGKHPADRHRHVVEQAEALAVAGEGVVEAAADVRGDAVVSVEGQPGGGQGAAGHQPEALDDRRRAGNLEPGEVFGRQGAVAHGVEVAAGMDQRQVVPTGRLGRESRSPAISPAPARLSATRRYLDVGNTCAPKSR